jgi:putative endonuclease
MSTSGRFFVYVLASRKYGVLYTSSRGVIPAKAGISV